MAKIGVALKINVLDIEKARLFKGQKGTYLDATVFIDLDNQDKFGNNGMITQDVSKEERGNSIQGNILGNVKIFWRGEGSQSNQGNQGSQDQGGGDFPEDDIPF